MSKTPATTIISLIFAPLYCIIALAALINVFVHGKGRRRAFVLLSIFGTVRTVGEILLIYAHFSKTTSTGVYTAGFLCHGLGYSFLLSSALSFYQRANPAPEGLTLKQKLCRVDNLVHYLSIVSLGLLISGYTSSDALSDPALLAGALGNHGSGKIHLDERVEIGSTIFMAITILFAMLLAFTVYQCKKGALAVLHATKEDMNEAKILLHTTAWTLPFLLIRSIYTAIGTLTSHPFGFAIASQVVCSYLMDVLAAVVMIVGGGFLVHRARMAVWVDEHGESGMRASKAEESELQTVGSGTIHPTLPTSPPSYTSNNGFARGEQK